MGTNKTNYHVTGEVERHGIINTYEHAFSPGQAIKIVAVKLKSELKREVFIKNAHAERVPTRTKNPTD